MTQSIPTPYVPPISATSLVSNKNVFYLLNGTVLGRRLKTLGPLPFRRMVRFEPPPPPPLFRFSWVRTFVRCKLTLPCRPYGIENSGLAVVLECSAFPSGYETPYSYYPTLPSLTSLDSTTFAPCEQYRIPIRQISGSSLHSNTSPLTMARATNCLLFREQLRMTAPRLESLESQAGTRPRRIVVTWRDVRQHGAHLIAFLETGPHVCLEMERNSLSGKYHIKRGMQGTKESYAQRSRISKTGIYMGCTHGEGARPVSVRWGGITI